MQVQRQIDELLTLRASEWLELLSTANEAEREAFAEWLGESRLHVQAFLEIAEIEFRLHRIDPKRLHDVNHLLSRIAPNVTPLGRPPLQVMASPKASSMRRSLHVGIALAACVSALAVALYLFHSPRASQFSTAIGEQKTVELADTSVITLNAASKIEVNLQNTERDIELRQGEAIFKVAHDPTRPFKVHTRAGTVRAVGTQFNVYDRPNGDTRVSVLEGRVQLTARAGADGSAGASQLLSSGQEGDIRLDGTIQLHSGGNVTNTVAWRQRRLMFDNAGLEDMVAEFNRYNSSFRMRLDGVPAGTFRYDGVFDAADPESFVSLLEKEPDLSVERRGNVVIVRPRSPPNQ